jgi:hypothetical protein
MAPRSEELVAALATADRQEHWAAFAGLMAMGEGAAPAVLAGLSHPDWRVRRSCALFADHHPSPVLLDRLRLALHDPRAKVRLFAVHGLACEPCKPGGNPIDPVPLLVRALKFDRGIRVRRHAAVMLSQQPPEPRIARAFRWVREHESDAKLRKTVARWMDRHGGEKDRRDSAAAR